MKTLLRVHDGARRRPYSSRDQRQRWVKSWRDSGLSQVDFARQHALRVGTLRRWIGKDSRPTVPMADPPAFQEFDLASLLGRARPPGSASWEVEIRLPSGVTLALAPGIPLSRVIELVEALRC